MLNFEQTFLEWCKQENIRVISQNPILYGIQLFVTDGKDTVSIHLYNKGTVLIQGKPCPLLERMEKQYSKAPSPVSFDHIGMDEAGKGDYFGPLSVACAYIKKEQEFELRKAGIKDSKEISDPRILEIYRDYQNKVAHEILVLMPAEYNQKYIEFYNLNTMLAWAHAQTLEKLLGRVPAKVAIADQFANPRVLERQLLSKGQEIKLIQQVRAESDTAVAIASIFARAAFLQGLENLRKEYNIDFPKGAYGVEKIGKEFVQKYTREKLFYVAKLHFKTTNLIVR
ncbi:MAG: ribonuclease HIII [Candidatus Brocadiae bacterium]|nr:ribonuclease HIII [Candidatus Brocadiia bacterium]